MNPGDLRNLITIQAKSAPVERDASGGETPAWRLVAQCWAAVEPLRGQEYLEATRLQAEISTRIRIRYRSGLAPAMRVILPDGRVLEIQSIIHVKEHRREIQLMCKEIVVETLQE